MPGLEKSSWIWEVIRAVLVWSWFKWSWIDFHEEGNWHWMEEMGREGWILWTGQQNPKNAMAGILMKDLVQNYCIKFLCWPWSCSKLGSQWIKGWWLFFLSCRYLMTAGADQVKRAFSHTYLSPSSFYFLCQLWFWSSRSCGHDFWFIYGSDLLVFYQNAAAFPKLFILCLHRGISYLTHREKSSLITKAECVVCLPSFD